MRLAQVRDLETATTNKMKSRDSSVLVLVKSLKRTIALVHMNALLRPNQEGVSPPLPRVDHLWLRSRLQRSQSRVALTVTVMTCERRSEPTTLLGLPPCGWRGSNGHPLRSRAAPHLGASAVTVAGLQPATFCNRHARGLQVAWLHWDVWG